MVQMQLPSGSDRWANRQVTEQVAQPSHVSVSVAVNTGTHAPSQGRCLEQGSYSDVAEAAAEPVPKDGVWASVLRSFQNW